METFNLRSLTKTCFQKCFIYWRSSLSQWGCILKYIHIKCMYTLYIHKNYTHIVHWYYKVPMFEVFYICESESHSVMSDSLQPHGLSSWNSPGQNTEVGSLSLLQGIFPTRDQTQVSHIAGGFFTSWTTRKAPAKSQALSF